MKLTDFSVPISKQVFISRYLAEGSLLKSELHKQGYEIVQESLIIVSQIRYSNAPKLDRIFPPSKNAIKYFFTQNPQIDSWTLFAVLRENSAKYLNAFGKSATFIGIGNVVVNIAKDFARLITTETVLFPQAIDSLQTVQRQGSFANISKNLFVYKTSLKSKFEIPKSEILVFTSRSNVTAYFTKYTISDDERVIAIGTTTLQKLKSYGINQLMISDSFSEEDLLKAVLEELNKEGDLNPKCQR